MDEQDITQAIPTINVIDELKDEVSRLSENNSEEHKKFSKNIKDLGGKIDEILLAQRREKRKKEVEEFINTSPLGFKIYAGTAGNGFESYSRLWIKIPNEDKTDFEYVVVCDLPTLQNYYPVKIFQGKTYNPPFFSPRGSVLIAVSHSVKPDGNGVYPAVINRFWFDIDKRKVTPVKDFSAIGEYFTALETITGKNFSRIYNKIDKYVHSPSSKNVLFDERVYMYDNKKKDFFHWSDREKM